MRWGNYPADWVFYISIHILNTGFQIKGRYRESPYSRRCVRIAYYVFWSINCCRQGVLRWEWTLAFCWDLVWHTMCRTHFSHKHIHINTKTTSKAVTATNNFTPNPYTQLGGLFMKRNFTICKSNWSQSVKLTFTSTSLADRVKINFNPMDHISMGHM